MKTLVAMAAAVMVVASAGAAGAVLKTDPAEKPVTRPADQTIQIASYGQYRRCMMQHDMPCVSRSLRPNRVEKRFCRMRAHRICRHFLRRG